MGYVRVADEEKGTLMHFLRYRLFLLFVLVVIGCGQSAEPAPLKNTRPANQSLKVVATFSILGDWVANVGGSQITLTTLVPAGGDAHTFEPSPRESQALLSADLIFEIGAGFEPWLDELYAASGSQALRIVVTDGLALQAVMGEGDEHGDETTHAEEGEIDPHVWQSPTQVEMLIPTIIAALQSADPTFSETYQTQGESYLSQLQGLKSWINSEIARLPVERRKLVTIHDTFGYFANEYQFELVGSALGSLTTESADPSAKEIAELVDTIRAENVPAIFAEINHNDQLIAQIANSAGAVLAPSLYADSLGAPNSEGAAYLQMLAYNVKTIVAALQEQE